MTDGFWGYRKVKVKAVIFYDNEGNCIIHGASNEKVTPVDLYKTALPLWTLDPSKEQVGYIEFEINLPDLDNAAQPTIADV